MDRFLSSSRHSSADNSTSRGTVTTESSRAAGGTRETRRPNPQFHGQSNSLPNTVGRGNKTQSLSIPISNSMRRSGSDTQLSQEEAEADHKDYLFYSRVVHGISSKQEHYQDGYLKYENELSLNNIVRTRNEGIYYRYDKGQHDGNANNFITSYDANGRPVLYNPFPVDQAEHDAIEAGIFDLDL